MVTHEIGVVGGGISGVSAAYHLACHGVDVALFERESIASGPTGRSSAVCRASYTNLFLAETAHASIEMLAELEERLGAGTSGFQRTGMLYMHSSQSATEMEPLVPGLVAAGLELEELSLEELARDHPAISVSDGERAIWEAGAGRADPVQTTQALADAATREGATIRPRTPIEQIALRPAGGALLTTADGSRFEVERLHLAAGPWTRALARQVGAELPLIVERHIVATFEWGLAEPISFVLADVPFGYYLTPEGHSQYGMGSLHAEPTVDQDDFDEAVSMNEALVLGAAAINRVPALANSATTGGWGSLYDVSPDWQPVIGEIAPGVFVHAGTSGHGFKLAPALGRQIAAMVAGEAYDPQLDQFSPDRFRTGALLDAGFGEVKILG